MNQKIIEGPDEISLKQNLPFFAPFHNLWGKNVYLLKDGFDLDPFRIDATSTSGSPVILNDNFFAGFLSDIGGGKFTFDGKETLNIVIPENQKVLLVEGASGKKIWKDYNEMILGKGFKKDTGEFWDMLEYCTWVEQKLYARTNLEVSSLASDNLDQRFVEKYMKRINLLGYPRGKLTIDDGWCPIHGEGGWGDWVVDKNKFPSFSNLIELIAKEGFIPGLWFAPVLVSPTSKFAIDNPDSVNTGLFFLAGDEKFFYVKPTKALQEHYKKIFSYYIELGIRKFKMDILYGPKDKMKELLKMIYVIIKKFDKEVEVECHIPDIFVSRYCDVVRTNDVSVKDDLDWKDLTLMHWKVCMLSSPDKVINLDHMGGNYPFVKKEEFLQHARLYRNADGHPVISLLPDRFGEEAIEEIKDIISVSEKHRRSLPKKSRD